MKSKKLLSIIAATLMFGSALALDHGSISVKNSQMYAQIDDNSGANTSSPISGLTVDFKLVTLGTTTWAWTELHGDYTLMGEPWSSQLRWWTPAKNANSLSGRVAGTQQSYGIVTSLPTENPASFSIFQHDSEGDWVFRETTKASYDYTKPNSKDLSDNTAPVLDEPVIANQSAVSLELVLSATDNSDDFFYYIADEDNGYEEVSFFNNINITLEPGTEYNFSIQAIDFSGNVSEAKTVIVTGETFECNNLLDNKDLALESVDFLPNWSPSTNYTGSVTDNILTAHLGDATTSQWQAQFWLSVNPPLVVKPGDRYSLLMDVEASNDMQFYVKVADNDDSNIFMEIPLQVAYAGETTTMAAYDLVCPNSLTQISKVIFDFGNSPANIDLTVSNISVCGISSTSDWVNKSTGDLSVFQSGEMISIISEFELKSVKLHSITGQVIMIDTNNNQINTKALPDGLYVLTVIDIFGNEKSFKVIL